jgi:hypothetical protein
VLKREMGREGEGRQGKLLKTLVPVQKKVGSGWEKDGDGERNQQGKREKKKKSTSSHAHSSFFWGDI